MGASKLEMAVARVRVALSHKDDCSHMACVPTCDHAILDEAIAAEQRAGAVAWGDINAHLRQHVEGIKDRGCAHYGEPFSCDKRPNGTRSLRPCEPCLMARLLDRASFDSLLGAQANPAPLGRDVVAYGLWDDTVGEWQDISPPTLDEATAEAWRLTGSLGHKYRIVPLRGDVAGSPVYKEPA